MDEDGITTTEHRHIQITVSLMKNSPHRLRLDRARNSDTVSYIKSPGSIGGLSQLMAINILYDDTH